MFLLQHAVCIQLKCWKSLEHAYALTQIKLDNAGVHVLKPPHWCMTLNKNIQESRR